MGVCRVTRGLASGVASRLAFLVCACLLLVAAGCASGAQARPDGETPAPSANREAPATATPEPSPTPTPRPAPQTSLGKVAFVQGGDVWVKALPDGEAKRLTQDGQSSAPLWSPSGEWLAYREGPRLRVVRASGADRHQVGGDGVFRFAWSPVADRLAYVGAGRLFAVSADGTDRRELAGPGSGIAGSGVAGFVWSPDGQWIACDRTELLTEPGKAGPPPDREASIWRVRADGGEASEVLSAGRPSDGGLLVAGWSPDGAEILYRPDPAFSNSLLADGTALLAVPATGGKPRELVKSMLIYPDFLAISPDRQAVAVAAGEGRESWTLKRIALIDLRSGASTDLTDESTAALSPAWSPDGKRIAYSAGPDVGAVGGGDPAKAAMAERRVWVMGRDGSDRRQLTSDPSYRDERPLWSTDGSRILFGRLKDDVMQLWLMRADGSEPRLVVDDLGDAPASDQEPSLWFGYYGHLDWDGLFDWWQGPPMRTSAPEPSSAGAPSSAPEGPEAFLQAAVAYLERPEARGLPETAVSAQLQDLARARRSGLGYLKRSEGGLEAWAGRVSEGDAFVLWRQGDRVAHQIWPRSGKDSPFVYFVNPPRALRLTERDGALEMGLITANLGSTADAWFVLYRLADDRWREVWTPAKAPRGSWASGAGTLEFDGPGLDALRLRGPLPPDAPGSHVFDEFGVFLKQQYESEWRCQGDGYVRVGGRLIPTPLTALAEFVDRLQKGDRAGALALAADSATVDEALRLRLDQPASGRGWLGTRQAEMDGGTEIEFFDAERCERSFAAILVRQAGAWRVKGVERVPPVLPGGRS